MPSLSSIPPFPTNVPVAHIHTVDFDALASGDKQQADLVYRAATGYGFFYLKNHHVDYDFMFDLANRVFSLPLEEKMKYDMGTTGHYFGYKRSGAMYVDEKGTPDHSEFYNISKDEVLGIGKLGESPSPHPGVVTERKAEIETYMRACHRVVSVLVSSLGESLGLDPTLLPSLHLVDRPR
jgi:isopenicillin N synthase-like dioxygenase